MLTIVAAMLVQVAAEVKPPRSRAANYFALSTSSCVLLASGRIVEGVSYDRNQSNTRFVEATLPPGLLAALPGRYKVAATYRYAHQSISIRGDTRAEPTAAQGVYLLWRETERQCAIVSAASDGAELTIEAADVLDRYEFKREASGVLGLKLPANPAVLAPSSDLTATIGRNASNSATFVLVENKE